MFGTSEHLRRRRNNSEHEPNTCVLHSSAVILDERAHMALGFLLPSLSPNATLSYAHCQNTVKSVLQILAESA